MRAVELDEVRAAVGLDALREAVASAFVAQARGDAVLPDVLHLDLGADRGDLHVKGAWLRDAPVFAIKVAGGFAGAVAAGLPAQQGLSLVFDATTGAPVALLDDRSWLTEARTGAAGAVAVDHLAPERIETLAVLGAGGQARHQVRAILRVRQPSRVVVWARRAEAAAVLADDLREEHPGLVVEARDTGAAATAGADVVVTVTPAREPLVAADAFADDVLVVAVGSDTPGKVELPSALLAPPARLVVDHPGQCATQGELRAAIAAGVRDADDVLVLGDLLAGPPAPARGRTVVDLTGLGVQDAAAAQLACTTLGLLDGRSSR